MNYYVIIHRPDKTVKAIGPLDSYKVAEAYADFIGNPNHEIVKTAHPENRWGAPLAYPWPIDQYEDND